MNDQNPTETVAPTESKPRLRDRLTRSNTTDATPKTKSSFKDKAKNVAAVVGVVTVVGVVAAAVTKRKSARVEVTLPDVEVSTQDA